MPIIDFENISDEELQKLCEFYLNYIRDELQDSSVRKDKSNLTKIDINANTKYTDLVMYYAEKEMGYDISHEKNNVEFYKKYYAYYQQSFRENINDWAMKCKMAYRLEMVKERRNICENSEKFLLKMGLAYKVILFIRIFKVEHFKESIEDIEKPFNIWKFHYRTLLVIDIYCWFILQTITEVITNKYIHDKIKIIQGVCDKLDSIIPKVEKVKCTENPFLTYAEFRLFSIFRTHFLEEITVLELLEKTHKDFKSPEKKYSLFDDYGNCKIITPEERVDIYLEGEKKGRSAFKTNFAKCIEFVELYNSATGRKLGCNDITLKAIYRELILETTARNKKKSKNIISGFLKNKEFNNYAEYYFINEKINWGIYREYNLIKEFQIKNQLQKKLYILVNLLLTRLKPNDILYESSKCFLTIISELGITISKDDAVIPIKEVDEVLSLHYFLPSSLYPKPSY